MTDTSTEPKNALPGEMGTMALAAATRELESDVARLRKQLKKLRVAATPRRDGPRRGRRLPAPGRGRFGGRDADDRSAVGAEGPAVTRPRTPAGVRANHSPGTTPRPRVDR